MLVCAVYVLHWDALLCIADHLSRRLMGKIYKCPGRMDGAKLQAGHDSHEDPSGHEWVIYDEAHILPCYLVDL